MKRYMLKGISLLVAAVMISPLSWLVYADDDLPENRQTSTVQSEESQPEDHDAKATEPEASETPVASEPSSSEETETADTTADKTEEITPAEPEAEPAPDMDEPLEAKASSVSAAAAASSGTQNEKTITIAGTKLDVSTDCNGEGWNYEKNSGRIVLRDCTGCPDIISDGTGVDIVTTGYNRIGTLSCDGDINVIGAGVLLIDKVELADKCEFNLHPLREYYGDDGGSVAVFVRQDDDSYLLVNGTVKGIIDEKIELPEDISLVLPADSLIELQAYKVMVEYDEEGNKKVTHDLSGYSEEELSGDACEQYGGHLVAGDLTLEKGSTIINNTMDDIVASIIVGGNLVNEGIISGGSLTVTKKSDGSGGLYSGSGTIKNTHATLRTGQTTSVNIADSILSLENGDYTIDELKLTGSVELFYGGALEIHSIKGSPDSSAGNSLYIYSFDMRDTLTLTEEIDRAAVTVKSGITELGASLKYNNGGTISNRTINKNYGGPVLNYSSLSTVSDGKDGPVFFGPKNITVPDPGSIPVVYLHLDKTTDLCNQLILEENKDEYTVLDNYDATKDESGHITYRDLVKKYFPDGLDSLESGHCIIYEVFSLDTGNKDGADDDRLIVTFLGEDTDLYEQAVSSEGVFLIRQADVAPWTNTHGGSTGTSTRASQTGSGNIGGNSNTIITGTGITRYSSDPITPEPETKPDPEPDPVKPDNVRPAGEHSIAAVSAYGDTLTIRINEFDLNEGNDNAEKVPYYNLSAYINGIQVRELSAAVEVEMEYALPEGSKDKPLYAVFANEDESSNETLKAVRAKYDEESGMLRFETKQTGEFIIAALEFDGTEFSPEFYDELEKTDEVKLFIKHLKEKKDDTGL